MLLCIIYCYSFVDEEVFKMGFLDVVFLIFCASFYTFFTIVHEIVDFSQVFMICGCGSILAKSMF